METTPRQPLVTVITATYNLSAALRLTLTSLLRQDFTDWEAWIIGDAATDDSAGVVASFGDPRLNWHNLPTNSGSQSGPNNEGIRRARGKYIAYLGHDDLWFPWHLSGLVRAIEESRADLVHSLSALIGPEGVVECMGPPGKGMTYGTHYMPPSSWLHRRDLPDACGPWADPIRVSLAVDIEFSSRAFRKGNRIACHPQLSVLKFPSHWFKAYAPGAGLPQQKYLAEMQADPSALERRILLDLAVAFARYRRGAGPSLRESIRHCMALLRKGIMDRLGPEHGPASAYRLWKYQRLRRKMRVKRGLPP